MVTRIEEEYRRILELNERDLATLTLAGIFSKRGLKKDVMWS